MASRIAQCSVSERGCQSSCFHVANRNRASLRCRSLIPFGAPEGGWSLLLRVADFGIDGEIMSQRLLDHGVCATAMTGWGETHGAQYISIRVRQRARPTIGIARRACAQGAPFEAVQCRVIRIWPVTPSRTGGRCQDRAAELSDTCGRMLPASATSNTLRNRSMLLRARGSRCAQLDAITLAMSMAAAIQPSVALILRQMWLPLLYTIGRGTGGMRWTLQWCWSHPPALMVSQDGWSEQGEVWVPGKSHDAKDHPACYPTRPSLQILLSRRNRTFAAFQ